MQNQNDYNKLDWNNSSYHFYSECIVSLNVERHGLFCYKSQYVLFQMNAINPNYNLIQSNTR